ncbi:MAG: sialate O-acetylesterase [Clostridia bacterium]|nr:sialate O-acetylesterase [Clostridia bacterium]
MIHSFLMVGQSNMAGRGFPADVEPIKNNKVVVMRNGIFRPMYVPVNPDRSFSGVSLAESFADAYQRETGIDTGLIPCADGGTSLDLWKEGAILFDHACCMAELAARSSEIKAILWHQGEADCAEARYPFYGERLAAMLEAFRRHLGRPDIPIILGGLGDFLPQCAALSGAKNYVHINKALEEVAAATPNCAFVPATGLDSNPDHLHFCSASLREFGLRYYEAYKQLAGGVSSAESANKPTEEHVATKLELL